jgi:hypothetical protein
VSFYKGDLLSIKAGIYSPLHAAIPSEIPHNLQRNVHREGAKGAKNGKAIETTNEH